MRFLAGAAIFGFLFTYLLLASSHPRLSHFALALFCCSMLASEILEEEYGRPAEIPSTHDPTTIPADRPPPTRLRRAFLLFHKVNLAISAIVIILAELLQLPTILYGPLILILFVTSGLIVLAILQRRQMRAPRGT